MGMSGQGKGEIKLIRREEGKEPRGQTWEPSSMWTLNSPRNMRKVELGRVDLILASKNNKE